MTTGNNDIWKARLLLRNVGGDAIYTSPQLNSPKMENQDGHPQTYEWSFNFKLEHPQLNTAKTAELIDITC
jgi:hypothetical protein